MEDNSDLASSRFGVRFGVFVCFDMLFPDPPMSLLDLGISHYVFPVCLHPCLSLEFSTFLTFSLFSFINMNKVHRNNALVSTCSLSLSVLRIPHYIFIITNAT